MVFSETNLKGAFIIDLEPRQDTRGFFARSFCAKEFAAHGLSLNTLQCNVAFTHRRGTVRGMHYQSPPAAEVKLVRCTKGAVCDVAVDLRPESQTYLQHIAVELSAANHRALLIPKMFAHGYQALTDDVEVTYQVDEFYAPDCERGLRYDDPVLNISWPLPPVEVSAKDRTWPLLSPATLVE
jgi:dTDP-4-dehydrorhamnose 3,5-epimerase